MNVSENLKQQPGPGRHLLRFRGDTCIFTLSVSGDMKGSAWLRTNIGQAETIRSEIIREVLYEESPLSRHWFDIPMIRTEPGLFRLCLPLSQVGHFEAKAYFLAEGKSDPLWPPGSNTEINVEPAHTCCANIIYNAFVRQFGPNKKEKTQREKGESDCVSLLDQAGYTVIPKSGTFRDLIRELDFIMGDLGCRYLQLLPIHPTPTTYGRMGRFGSPYAALSFTEVDPALAEFDPKATPLEQFIELLDAVHGRQGKLIMDIAINHTGWAASLHETHPHWLARDEEGRIEMPGAWGVTWADLTKLDYRHRDLWQYMADVFLTWCKRGVDGFRCDAGYMIPLQAWTFITATVREQYPDTVFFLEGLGGKISVTRALLNTANLNWAYSELFQNYDRGQIEHYLPGAFEIGRTDGVMIHFAETHDNNRLASRSHTYARMRTALCALTSLNGGFGFANGVEWLAGEKINVHESSPLNWGAAENQVAEIRRLSRLLRSHPAFHDRTELKMIQEKEGNGIVLLRHHRASGRKVLVLVNLDDENPARLFWKEDGEEREYRDLLSGQNIRVEREGEFKSCGLVPGQVCCLEAPSPPAVSEEADRILRQCYRAKALELYCFYRGTGDTGDFDPDTAAGELAENPAAFCRSQHPRGKESNVICWQWPEDLHRELMIPPDHFLLLRAPHSFRASVQDGNFTAAREESLPSADGNHFALFSPLPVPPEHRQYRLRISVFSPDRCRHGESDLLYLASPGNVKIRRFFSRPEILKKELIFLGSNGRGGMLRAAVSWGELYSRYDALLAANISPRVPEDRRILFTRCRAWVVFQGFSYEIGINCLDSFAFDEQNRAFWKYRIPTGQGSDISFFISMEMIQGYNAMRISFFRALGEGRDRELPDGKAVRLILRPDVEDRSFHDTTKAFTGPEHDWPKAVRKQADGFIFAPAPDRTLEMGMTSGNFVYEPEWHYMVFRSLEDRRGLDPHSDLFSPGYFSAYLKGGEGSELRAWVKGAGEMDSAELLRKYNAADYSFPGSVWERMSGGSASDCVRRSLTDCITRQSLVTRGKNLTSAASPPGEGSFTASLITALDHYIVRRDHLQTVIAGYPWFLDWGRDTLIAVRGLIAAGKTAESRAILKQFARFEEKGTLPNMIRGEDAGNRDTSDAPLWFYRACADLLESEGNDSFLQESCGARSIRETLADMADSMMQGTPNGIRTDPKSGLIFSPSHFTWMDTNHPAGTPREGYPVEIQALWHSALSFLARIFPEEKKWSELAQQVRESLIRFFFREDKGYLSDCLHARAGESAMQAKADDALRPNQLFAITMGAVENSRICRSILEACSGLIVPGAIRSLADRPVEFPLEIRHHGNLLNDPHRPYQGRYEGDEDTQRKPAYHNGTAWTWVFPSFCEAWAEVYGKEGAETALAWLGSCTRLMNTGCVGQMPEILDGNAPHSPRGCDAQAWGVSELLRVWIKLSNNIEQ